MRFTVIGHAALFVEAGASRQAPRPTLLVDPWLFGSCGWRSWWHFPPSVGLDEAWFHPDYVYLTHHHPDHFHYPSMRRIDRSAQVLVPRFGVDVMPGEVRGLGFRQVRELPHGEVTELAPGLRVASYQHGFDDTAFAVACGDVVVVDLNDAKLRGHMLDRIVQDFGHPTFMLRSHSWAQAYPHCYTADDPADLNLVSRESFLEDFIDAARHLKPRYAIPFGSMVGFLHPETRRMNAQLVTPGEVLDAFERAEGVGDTRVVPMAPGDSWDEAGGFDRSDRDWYTDRERHLDELAESVRPKIERETAEEARRELSWEDFERYFDAFLRAMPPGVGPLLLRRRIVFEVPGRDEPWWSLDFGARRVHRDRELPADRACVIRIPEGVLSDAIEKRILHFVHGSARLQIHLRPRGVNEDFLFWGLLMLFEIGYLPISRRLDARTLSVAWRRRIEARDWLDALGGTGSFLRRISSGLATPTQR